MDITAVAENSTTAFVWERARCTVTQKRKWHNDLEKIVTRLD